MHVENILQKHRKYCIVTLHSFYGKYGGKRLGLIVNADANTKKVYNVFR